ncbi:MAG: c-type cytochrome [Candidatus Solibacter usitatus]|nr:c-type cytochrome [Candidatus Solibacter usitatus]
MHSKVLLFALTLPALLSAQNRIVGNAAEAEAGRGLFRIVCAPCHGIQAKGGRGPDLTTGVFNSGNRDEDLFRVISQGVSGTEMPGYGVRFGTDNIWRFVAYLRSATNRRAVASVGNATAGEKLFWSKGACGQCHRVGQRGGPMGPDLTRAGRKRSYEYLRAALTDPNAELTTGYYKITVVTRDGKTISGVQKGFDNFSAQLMTVDGVIHSFLRENVQSCEREYVSLMPSYKSWSETELNDIVAFLVTLRGDL